MSVTLWRRRALAALLVGVLLGGGALATPVGSYAQAPAAPAAAARAAVDQAAIADAVTPLQEAYTLLLERYAVPLDAAQVAGAAQAGMDAALQDAGVAAPSAGLGAFGDGPEEHWVALRQRFQALAAQYGDRVSPSDLEQAAVASMADSVDDAHTHFVSPSEFADEQQWEQGSVRYGGIGARMEGTTPTIVEVFPDSPAAQAGLGPGDTILAVDGQSTANSKLDEVVDHIRGPEGTPVSLQVQRAGSAQTEDVTLVRAQVDAPFVESRRLAGDVGYVELRGFPEPSVVSKVEQAITSLQAQGVRGIVLDLRGNGGGRLDVGSRLLGDFVPAGPIYQSVDREGHTEVGTVQDAHKLLTVPLVVLVDDGTASMGEIFASAIQEHHVGEIVGTTTAGAVAASVFLPLSDGSALQLSIERVYSGAGALLDKVGVQPDHEVARDLDALRAGHDTQLEQAVSDLHTQAAAGGASAA
ncbi:MAG TPA: S41 family peptidase [Chloroflexota bacterium]|jgi:carboxyl-terminal processing protease